MIAGFNTDIEFGGVVYHVQTEDKGAKSRLILTLVYDRGTILASKRVKYDDLKPEDLEQKALAERVQRQHQVICAAVKAGRLNDLKKLAAKDGRESSPAVTAGPAIAASTGTAVLSGDLAQAKVALGEAPVSLPAVPGTEQELPIILTEADIEAIPVYEIFDDGPVVDCVSVLDDEEIVPAEAVAIVSDLVGASRPSNNKLGIELLGDSKFRGGDRKTVTLMICRGSDRKVISDAEIMVKILGSSFRPVIFHARSDENGLAKVHLQLPHFEAGRAALLVRARNNGDEVELRKIITPG